MENQDIKKGEPFDSAQGKLKELELKCEEYLNGWKRERADFLNYKKDEMERIGNILKYANEEIILNILPILDNIERAESELPEGLRRAENGSKEAIEWTKGFLQIKNQIQEFLKREGIEPIETLGKLFDPNMMESVESIEKEGIEPGIVVEELEKGYTMHGKLIRPAKVKISK